MTLLSAAPVRFDADLGLWLVTRYRDVEDALASEDLGIAGGSDPTARAAVARTAVT
ncbi:MAG: hypothetical protein HKO98_14915, partial [Gemmatimonadetes bacterium]|nr:hypothetical protein [Gemmatimonadota bacterium]